MNFRRNNNRRPEANLDMTPLIDVVFLLLIFFLVTTTFARPTQSENTPTDPTAQIPVDLQVASSGQSSEPSQSMNITVDGTGAFFIDSEPVSADALKARLAELKAQGQKPSVNLRADKSAQHGQVIEALDLIKGAGVEQVNFVIKKNPATPGPAPAPAP
jgi:biopolymer transport protein ExbD